MTPLDFNFNLSKMQQYALLKKEAVVVAERNDGKHRYFLFQLESFYVEARFHIELEAIQEATASYYEQIPHTYLDQIDIKELIARNAK